jgi:ABC-type antimicrobial peptide transport system permease subunit
MLNKPLGFNKEAILTIPLTDFNKDAYQTLRKRFLKQPDIRQVSYSMGNPSSKDYFGTELKNAENPNSPVYQAMIRSVDKSYLDTYGLEVISGDWFHEEFTTWKKIHFVINEKLVKEPGFKTAGEAIGKKITALGVTAPITGVVKDFHVKSLHEAIEPVAMFNCPVYIGEAAIQVQDKNMPATLSFIENTWKEAFPEKAFTYTFLDEQLARYYQTEALIANAFNIFAGIAVLISCLGLFGLISFMVASRTKEIGIRKVLGAPALHVIWLFSKEYVVLLSIAFAMAAPVAYYCMHNWLQSFIYHIEIGAGTFMMAAIVSVLTASVSVCYLIIKAARANPIQSLRNE